MGKTIYVALLTSTDRGGPQKSGNTDFYFKVLMEQGRAKIDKYSASFFDTLSEKQNPM